MARPRASLTRAEAIADFERYLALGKNGYWRIEASNQIHRLVEWSDSPLVDDHLTNRPSD